ncbi:hypothetical protein CRG98_018192 [Punica granatum]|uniref:Uncharacterized protein n=1 Tax=Punica granatum TaxID=22663 RepID=A0A2I0JYK5_PUNGR|nr:hypothetical protein CRG98_018192 [Punica granatum]
MKVFREISPKGFKWRAAWMPPGPMALRCSDFNRVPLVSHAGRFPRIRCELDSNILGGRIRHPWIAKVTSKRSWPHGEQWSLGVRTSPSIRPMRNRNSRLRRNMSFAFIDRVLQHTKIPLTLHKLKPADHLGHSQPRIQLSKLSSITSGTREIVFAGKSQRKVSNLWISGNYRESSPKPTQSYRGASGSWHERMSP